MLSRRVEHAVALAFVITAPTVNVAAAEPYDGFWTVSIVTERGTCNPAYQFDIQIVDGVVTYQGPRSLSGRVSSRGSVIVSISLGDKHASGSGNLSPTSGRGRWAGGSGSDHCSGSWTGTALERRDQRRARDAMIKGMLA